MAKDITLTWELPTTRRDGGAVTVADIKHVRVESSADGGANFAELVVVDPNSTQSFVLPETEIGEWQFRLIAVDQNDKDGIAHVEVVEVPDDSPLNPVTNVQVTLN